MVLKVLVIISSIFMFYQGLHGQPLDSLYNRVVVAINAEEYEEASYLGVQLLEDSRAQQDPFYQVQANFMIAYSKENLKEFGEAVLFYLEGARIARANPSNALLQEKLISLYKNLGNILGDHEYYNLAFKVQDEAIAVAIKQGNQRQIISVTVNKIHELVAQENYEKALKQIQTLSSSYSLKLEDEIALWNKEGIIYKNQNAYEKALSSYGMILERTQEENEYHGMALHNIAEIHLVLGDTALAINYLLNSIQEKITHNRIGVSLITSYIEVAKINISRGQYKDAIELLKEAEEIDGETSVPETQEVYQLLANAYRALGDSSMATKYDLIYQQRKADKKKDLEILTDRHFDLIHAHFEKDRADKIAFWSIVFAAIFLLIGFIWYYKYSRNKHLIKKELNVLINKLSGQA